MMRNDEEYANGLFRFYWALRHRFTCDKSIELYATPRKIAKIEEWLATTDFSGIQVLCMTGQGLTFIPAAISRFTNLWFLNVSGNKLSALPPELSQLQFLTQLDISQNNFAQTHDVSMIRHVHHVYKDHL
jgi:Leucine-rich repeat (LRR) protein